MALLTIVNTGVRNIGDVSANHVVDGHCNKVVKLFWSIIVHFKLSSLLEARIIINEIDCVNCRNMSCYGQNKICCEIASGEARLKYAIAWLIMVMGT